MYMHGTCMVQTGLDFSCSQQFAQVYLKTSHSSKPNFTARGVMRQGSVSVFLKSRILNYHEHTAAIKAANGAPQFLGVL